MGTDHRRAFTLLELILVMVILSTSLALVLPRFGGVVSRQRLRASARRILAVCGRARQEACAFALRYRVVFDQEEEQYWVEVEAEPLEEPGGFRVVASAWGAHTQLSQGIGIESVEFEEEELTEARADASPPYIEFRPDGTADAATVELVTEKNDRLLVQVDGVVGRARIAQAP